MTSSSPQSSPMPPPQAPSPMGPPTQSPGAPPSPHSPYQPAAMGSHHSAPPHAMLHQPHLSSSGQGGHGPSPHMPHSPHPGLPGQPQHQQHPSQQPPHAIGPPTHSGPPQTHVPSHSMPPHSQAHLGHPPPSHHQGHPGGQPQGHHMGGLGSPPPSHTMHSPPSVTQSHGSLPPPHTQSQGHHPQMSHHMGPPQSHPGMPVSSSGPHGQYPPPANHVQHRELPDSPEKWLTVSHDYENLWNFPQCLGAIDGKHVVLQCPFRSGSEYYNYKGTFSIVLMAVVDAKYRFLYANVGCQGRISDGGVFKNTLFSKKLNDGTLNLPSAKLLPGHQDRTTPFVFVCDDAFPLQENLMKPFPGEHAKGTIQRSFNYRLSRARRVVENVFGVMSSVFRVLRKPLLVQPVNAEKIILACCYLHNFLQNNKLTADLYTPPGTYDSEDTSTEIFSPGSWRNEPEPSSTFLNLNRIGRKSTRVAQEVREQFANYFSTNGRVPWQDKME